MALPLSPQRGLTKGVPTYDPIKWIVYPGPRAELTAVTRGRPILKSPPLNLLNLNSSTSNLNLHTSSTELGPRRGEQRGRGGGGEGGFI